MYNHYPTPEQRANDYAGFSSSDKAILTRITVDIQGKINAVWRRKDKQ